MEQQHYTLHRTLLIGLIGVFVLLALYAIYQLRESFYIQEQLIDEFMQQASKTQAATDMQVRAYERSDLLYAMLIEQDPFVRDSLYLKFEKSGQGVADARRRFDDFALHEGEKQALSNQRVNIQQTEIDQENIVDLLQRDETQQAQQHMQQTTVEIQNRVNHNFEVIRQLQYEATDQSIKQARLQLKDTLVGFGILLIVVTSICIYIAISMYRKVITLADDLVESNTQLTHDASHDALTHIYNRRHMNQLIQQRLDDKQYNGYIFSIDLDNFKAINDQYGHSTGDKYIIKIAELLSNIIDQHGQIARYGGDEFIALTNSDQNPAEIAERMLALSQISLVIDLCKTNISMSIGVVRLTSNITTLDQAIRLADDTMYEAKRNGKNQFIIAS